MFQIKVNKMSDAKRPRNAWFLDMSNVLGVYQVDIGYKNTKGEISPFSTSKRNAYVKRPFGPPVKCEYRVKSTGNEIEGEYKFVNNHKDTAVLPDSLLNNFDIGTNTFIRKVNLFRSDNKKDLLAKYLTLILHSDKFVHHSEELHSSDGFLLDGTGVTEAQLVTAGGSLDDYNDFVKVVKENAKEVLSVEKRLEDIRNYFVSNGKRKANGNSAPKAKLSKQAAVDQSEKEELTDVNGLEIQFKNSYVGLTRVPLSNIKISPDMEGHISPNRVKFVVSSIRQKFDPSLSVFVVITEEDKRSIDLKNVGQVKFLAVQKLHTLQAFKELEKSGEFSMLHGHEDKKVLCFVLNTNRPEMLHYGHQRNNEISSQFCRKTRPQDILHYFNSLTLRSSKVNSIKVVDRMAKLSRLGPDECTAVSKLCQWSSSGFSALMEMMEVFENYQTLDVKPSGHMGSLARGEKLSMTNVLFKMLGKCSEQYFVSHYQAVVDSSISLKTMLDGFKEAGKVQKVCGVVSVLAGNESYDKIKEMYPGKFDFDVMKNFIGAELKGENRNTKAGLLEKYFKSVIATNENERVIIPLEFEDCSDIAGKLNEDFFTMYEAIIFHMKELNQDICKKIISHMINSTKPVHAALLIFPSEKDQFQVLSYLRNQNTMLENFKIVPISFNREVKSSGDVVENISYSILFGKLSIINPPLKVHYRGFENLINIVECVIPLQSSVALLCDPGVECSKIHSDESDRKVSYFAPKSSLQQLINKPDAQKSAPTPSLDQSSPTVSLTQIEDNRPNNLAQSDVHSINKTCFALGEDSSHNLDQNGATTSPVKSCPPPTELDDSGVFEGNSQFATSSAQSSFSDKLDKIAEEIDFD